MYNNNSQYPAAGFSYPPPSYSQEYDYNYQGYTGYGNQANPSQSAQSQSGTQGNFTVSNWTSYTPNQNDAVAQEVQQQKAQLIRQREDYVKKASLLKNELEQLQAQKQDLMGNKRSANSDLTSILQQNSKLQEEIQGKMKAIHNVIEMLSGIIKDGQSIHDLETLMAKQEKTLQLKSPTPTNSEKSHTPEGFKNIGSDSYSYVHYDTGLHWCRMCDEFPETAKDFLLHLQDKKHREMMKDNEVDSTPWHKLPAEILMPTDENAPTKRIPIKGLQFFISAPSWYCKLCDVWIGDLHCASQHLKSKTHYQNYENFVSQNPHWEMEWIKDREKAMGRRTSHDSSDSEDERKKRKRKEKHLNDVFSLKEKKKKKRSKRKKRQSSDSSSSSSSSDSSSDDKSRSIRVAMRNMKKTHSILEEDLSSKWSVLEKIVEEHKKKEQRDKEDKFKDKKEAEPLEDTLINQWMSVPQPPAKEKLMLDSLRNRMRQKQENERARLAEMEKKNREKEREQQEREEQERTERKKREEKERLDAVERQMKQREIEEMQRIKEREKNQFKFKTGNYRRSRRSQSGSGDDDQEDDRIRKYNRRASEREGSYKNSRSRSKSQDRRSYERGSPDRMREENDAKKKPPGPPSYKKLPFIGRMPLFKNKSKQTQEEKEEPKEIKKQSYDPARRTRFEPGNLPKAFIPKPEVVCFPKLSSIPPLSIPPPPPTITTRVSIPDPPKIVESPRPPPPPKMNVAPKVEENNRNLSDDEVLYGPEGVNPSMMGQYYQHYENSGYPPMNPYTYEMPVPEVVPPPPPHSHSMPLQPPPLPPDDDLALLGICADDMAAQSF